MTHTYALLEVSGSTYDEIALKMREAGYDAFRVEGSRYAIDMHGIALIRADRRRNPERRKADPPPHGVPVPARRLWPDRRKS